MKKLFKNCVLPLVALTSISLAGCGDSGNEALNGAAEYIDALYCDAAVNTTGDFEVLNKVIYEGTTYTITWSVEIAEGGLQDAVKVVTNDAGKTVVDVTFDSVYNTVETQYVLKASISDGVKSVELKYNHVVPKFVFTSVEDYLKAKTGDLIVVKGRVIMKSAFNANYTTYNVWVQNEEGGYYAYKLPLSGQDAYDALAIGTEVILSGSKSPYNGQQELANPTYVIVDSTPAEVPYVDATEAFANAASGKDTASLDRYQNMKIVLKDVELLGITPNSSGDYYNFKVGDNEFYLRASSSYQLNDAQIASIFTEWTAGFKADVYGVCNVYSNQFYLQPVEVDSVKYTSKTLSTATILESSLEEVAALFEETYTSAASVTLPANPTNELFKDVALTYALNAESDTANFAIADGKLNITIPTNGEPAVGKIDVTATLNGESKTSTIEVVATIPQPVTVASFLEAKDTATTQYLKGIVTAVNKVGSKGAFVLTDSTSSIFCYDGLEVALGDEILISCVYSENYSTPQIGKPTLLSTVSTDNDVVAISGEAYSFTAASVAEKFAAGTASNESLAAEYSGKYLEVTGYVYQDGNYYNLAAAADSTGYVVSCYANSGINLSAYAGQLVTIRGYYRGCNVSKTYITIQLQSVTPVTE